MTCEERAMRIGRGQATGLRNNMLADKFKVVDIARMM